jgi:hypothetical protein
MILNRLYLAAGIVAVAGLLWWRYDYVASDREALKTKLEQSESNLVAAKKTIEDERAELLRVNSILTDLETKEAEVRYVETIVEQEVIKYRDRVVNRCQLSDEWLSIHNRAASGTLGDSGTGEIQSAAGAP